jgi:hypothetical protein
VALKLNTILITVILGCAGFLIYKMAKTGEEEEDVVE